MEGRETVWGDNPPRPGMVIYVADPQIVWRVATITEVTGESATVQFGDSKLGVISLRNAALMCPSDSQKVCNLTELSPLNEATVLDCLQQRYESGIYYSRAGSTLVAVNPFTDIPGLYDHQAVHHYSSQDKESTPHIYSIGEKAYSSLRWEVGQVNQSIIISGESGAGKTVTAKHLLKYLAVRAHPHCTSPESKLPVEHTVEDKILDSNPILEAFGNSSTPRNDNSSRFGKYIQLQFSRSGEVTGATINTYLLEKTRVAHQSDTDCNFHIFYQVIEALSSGTLNIPQLTIIKDTRFRVLPRLEAYARTNMGNKTAEHWQQTKEAMNDLGLTTDLQQSVFEVLVAILYLGNVQFDEEDEDCCAISSDQESIHGLEMFSEILGLKSQSLDRLLLFRNIQSMAKSRRSVFVKPLTKRESESRRDCLAMLIYSRLFDWLVEFINSKTRSQWHRFIGLLDIYGFEDFNVNSLEQLCINYANEKLQQHYICQFLKDLQMEYSRECIEWEQTDFVDNEPCLRLLEGKLSVFGLLNEEVYLNRKSDSSSIQQRIVGLTNKTCSTPKLKKVKQSSSLLNFIVCHYAGDVSYAVEGMVEKNKDNIPVEFISLLRTSGSKFVCELFSEVTVETEAGRKTKTVLTKFKNSLDSLMSVISGSDVYYIRCIKPNAESRAGVFNRRYVMDQLLSNGIIETVQVCRQGYGARILYREFLQRYSLLIRDGIGQVAGQNKENEYEALDQLMNRQLELPERRTPTSKKRLRRRTGLSSSDHTRKHCAAVLKAVFKDSYKLDRCCGHQFGKTKLFLKNGQLEELEAARTTVMISKAVTIQSCWRGYVSRCTYQGQVQAATLIQTAVRLWLKKGKQAAMNQLKHVSAEHCNPRSPKRSRTCALGLDSLSMQSSCPLKTTDSVDHTGSQLIDGECGEGLCKKKVKLDVNASPTPSHGLICGHGIVSRRRLPRVPIRFHTRVSLLKNAHNIHRREYECSLTDCLPDT